MAKVDQLFFRIQDRGGEAWARYLSEALGHRGHDVGCLGYVRGREEGGPVTTDWLVLAPGLASPGSVVRAQRALWRHWKRRRPDVVISHTQVASLIGLPLARLAGVRIRVALHHQPHGRDLGWPFWVSDALAGWLGIYTDVVLVSDLALERVARFPRRYRRRVSLIRNEVPPVAFVDRQEARERLDLPVEGHVFCFIGAVSERKGADVAAQAVAAAGGHLLVAGRADDAWERVNAIAAESDGRIRVLGHLDPADVPSVLRASTCFVFPSVVENRPLAVLEAEAAGLQVLASDITGNRDVLGDRGRYLPVGDVPAWTAAVAEVLAAPVPEPRGEERGTRFEDMLSAYESIIGRP